MHRLDRSLILLDSNVRRRAAISHALAAKNVHVDPFETVEELTAHWPRSGLVLANDEPGTMRTLVSHMVKTCNWMPLIAFAEKPTPRQIVDAIHDGAGDFVAFPFEEQVLGDALFSVQVRAEAMGNGNLREAMARSRVDRLTNREREVLAGVAQGLSNRLIGAKLAISPRTVEIHRANMLNKIEADHTSTAIRVAIEANLVA